VVMDPDLKWPIWLGFVAESGCFNEKKEP
jgi:hypothetical protein